jgi:hypothetical protein
MTVHQHKDRDSDTSAGTRVRFNAKFPSALHAKPRKDCGRRASKQNELRKQVEAVRHDVEVISHSIGSLQVAAGKGWSTCVLHPEKTQRLRRWDVVTTIALVYTCTLTPFEAAFIEPITGVAAWDDPWFRINRVLDMVFLIDLVVQFFVAYPQDDDIGGRVCTAGANQCPPSHAMQCPVPSLPRHAVPSALLPRHAVPSARPDGVARCVCTPSGLGPQPQAHPIPLPEHVVYARRIHNRCSSLCRPLYGYA